MKLPIEQIKPSPYQPRLTFDLEDIRGSIQKDGILVALTVRKKDGYFELIDGERRLRLAKELGYETVKCDVIDVDDETAMGMVWTINIERKDYSLQEKVRYATILQGQKLSVEAIAHKMRYTRSMVYTFLNIQKLPKKYQKFLWAGAFKIGHIHLLQPLFNGSSVNINTILNHLEVAIDRKLTQNEFQAYLKPELEEIERRRVESAKKAVGKIELDIKEPETPEELEKAAEALKKEAKKRKSPKQIHQEKWAKVKKSLFTGRGNAQSKIEICDKLGIDADEFQEQLETIGLYKNPDKALKAAKNLKKQIDQKITEEKKRREDEKRRKREEEIQRKAEQEAKEKLLKDKDFIKEAAKLASQIPDEPTKADLPFDIPSVDKQLDKIFGAMAEIDPDTQILMKKGDFTGYIRGYIKRKKVVCPICGETHLQWRCGHDF